MTPNSAETEARARFEQLFSAHYGELTRFARRRVGDDAAGDVVAETFLIAWRRLGEIPPSHPRAWLYTTAGHVIANELRARQRRDRLRQHALHDHAIDRAVAGDHAGVIAEQIRVRVVLESLSPMDQEVLRLTEWERLELSEAAAVLGCSCAAVKVRLHRTVACTLGLCSVHDDRRAVAELVRVLRPGGLLLLPTSSTRASRPSCWS